MRSALKLLGENKALLVFPKEPAADGSCSLWKMESHGSP